MVENIGLYNKSTSVWHSKEDDSDLVIWPSLSSNYVNKTAQPKAISLRQFLDP